MKRHIIITATAAALAGVFGNAAAGGDNAQPNDRRSWNERGHAFADSEMQAQLRVGLMP